MYSCSAAFFFLQSFSRASLFTSVRELSVMPTGTVCKYYSITGLFVLILFPSDFSCVPGCLPHIFHAVRLVILENNLYATNESFKRSKINLTFDYEIA